MEIAASSPAPVLAELDLLGEMLPLEGAGVLELGCGTAGKTRAIAKRFAPGFIEAAEVDSRAQSDNRAAQAAGRIAENIQFVDYGAQSIARPDSSIDIVLMFKSLHHVPQDSMAQAMQEIRRVLKPNGLAYLSEPVFAGELNEVIRLFHDEAQVRQQAFAAVQDAVEANLLELVEQRFFTAPVRFRTFDEFANGIIHATHSAHHLSPSLLAQVEEKFNSYQSAEGFYFETPNRIDLLRAPV